MDLTPYIEHLRRELAVAAEAGGEDARALAERLSAPLESAARLTLLNALSAAADEITRDLAPGSVDVRLRGVDPEFAVTPAPVDRPFGAVGTADGATAPVPAAPVPAVPSPVAVPDDGGAARINLRLPAHLKVRAEQAAGADGLSVNAWLVRAVAAALEPGDQGRGTAPLRNRGVGQSYTGWVR